MEGSLGAQLPSTEKLATPGDGVPRASPHPTPMRDGPQRRDAASPRALERRQRAQGGQALDFVPLKKRGHWE